MARLDNAVTVVTGAGGGVGRQAALRLSAEGSRVGLTDLDASSLEETAALVREAGGEAIAVAGDIVSEQTSDTLTTQLIDVYGKVDGLVNNAGIAFSKPLLEHTVEDFDKVIHINTLSCLVTAKRVVPEMVKAGGGSVVNVSSIGALAALPNIGIYCASKAAVLGLTRSLAMEYAPHNVRANILCPGLVDTQMAAEHQKSFPTPQDAIDALAGRQMLKRYAQPQEIAEVIVFLISKEASFMTGATVPVEAGWTAW
ncbi:SDR family NAD(P)-dependent oxidoreductase [Streptomyces brevispora]|uniref:SDR family NAD(P)-dependent oxidoreductase n=1 Tax=Streptomyces brevispora TaxID=887462 RepID=UPI003714464C